MEDAGKAWPMRLGNQYFLPDTVSCMKKRLVMHDHGKFLLF